MTPSPRPPLVLSSLLMPQHLVPQVIGFRVIEILVRCFMVFKNQNHVTLVFSFSCL